MRDSNISTTRRIEALESRLDAQERAFNSQAQRARGWQWPRDMWLGRTYALTESSYPTEGDTFQVKLLSAHFTATEGERAVTENERGTIVTARTWPAKYLPYDTEVVVKRMRGIGPNGAGEWWIETTEAAASTPLIEYSATSGLAYPGISTSAFAWGISNARRMRIHPTGTANDYFDAPAPANFASPWLVCRTAGRYLFAHTLEWNLHGIPGAAYSDMQQSYYTAPSGTVYPVFSRYGVPSVYVSSAFNPISNDADIVGDCRVHSHLPIRPDGTYFRGSHCGAWVHDLAVGDVLTYEVVWSHDYVAPPSYVGSFYGPQAELSRVEVAIALCSAD